MIAKMMREIFSNDHILLSRHKKSNMYKIKYRILADCREGLTPFFYLKFKNFQFLFSRREFRFSNFI